MSEVPAVTLARRYASFQEFLSATSGRLSPKGALLPGDPALEVGDPVGLRLTLEDGFALVVGRGRVVWRQGSDVGVEFVDLSDDSHALLEKIAQRYRAAGDRLFDLDVDRPRASTPSPAPAAEPGPDPFEAAPPSTDDTMTGEATVVQAPSGTEVFIPPDPMPAPGRPEPGPPVPSPAAPPPQPRAGKSRAPRRAMPSPPPDYVPPPLKGRTAVASSAAKSSGRRPSWGLVVLVLLAGAAGGATYSLTERLVDWWAGSSSVAAGPMRVRDVPPPGALSAPPPPAEPASPAASPAEDEVPGDPLPPAQTEARPAEPQPAIGDGALTLALPARVVGSTLSRIRLVTSRETEDGTEVTLWGDGALPADRLDRTRLEGELPREVLKLQGIQWPLRDPVIRVGSPELLRIRSGLHARSEGSELHLVLDLAAPAVELTRVEQVGSNLRLTLSR